MRLTRWPKHHIGLGDGREITISIHYSRDNEPVSLEIRSGPTKSAKNIQAHRGYDAYVIVPISAAKKIVDGIRKTLSNSDLA